MRRAIILVAAALVLIWLYSVALAYALEFTATQPAPSGWSYLFPTLGGAVLSWMFLRHTIAVLLASVPFAFLIARLYPCRWLLVTLAATGPIYLVATLPEIVQNFGGTPLRLKIADVLDAVKLVGTLPLLTWTLRNLPWSGPPVNKVPGSVTDGPHVSGRCAAAQLHR